MSPNDTLMSAGSRIRGAYQRVAASVKFSKPGLFARRRPALAAVLALLVVGGGALGVALAAGWRPHLASGGKSLVALKAEAKGNPKDAQAQRDLGHAQFKAGRHVAAVAAYQRALKLDPGVADATLASNLVACFGKAEQKTAEQLIGHYKIVAAEPGLEKLAHSKRQVVRWGAVRTLEAIGKASRADYAAAYVQDLDSQDCDVRRRAVEKLGQIGDKSALAALHRANRADEKTGGVFSSKCLGDRPEKAEKAILARR